MVAGRAGIRPLQVRPDDGGGFGGKSFRFEIERIIRYGMAGVAAHREQADNVGGPGERSAASSSTG